MLAVVLIAGALAAAMTGAPGAAPLHPGPPIEVLSSHPDLVSGGDCLVRVRVPEGTSAGQVRVAVNGRDITSAFTADLEGRSLTGLVTGLRVGDSEMVTTAPGTGPVRLVLRNHPISGPVFAGPKEQPFLCQTVDFRTATGQHLGKSAPPDCTVPTRVDHVDRKRVPHRIRVETGVIDRAIYEIAMPEGGWNGRLIYTFGGGCPGGWHTQGKVTAGVLDEVMLRRGYAVASSTLNVFGTNCDDLLASEVMSMVKERFVEEFGPPLFTIGWGCSGGSYQAHQIADNYPGLLDGIAVACSFPDLVSSTQVMADAALLHHYFPGSTLTPAQQRAVAGFALNATTSLLAAQARRINPKTYCPADLRSPARCDVFDHAVNVYGRDPATGFARRPLDNVGVQYGLSALNSGAITADQFVDLNQRIGGFDNDGGFTSPRTVADPTALAAAYRTGRVLSGAGGLGSIPIIDYRSYTDDQAGGDLHLRFESEATRARLIAANGDADNQVMLVEDGSHGGFVTSNPVVADLLARLDSWLAAVGTGRTHAEVVRGRPAGLVDTCWTRGSAHQKVTDTERCNGMFPIWPTPRQVAGDGAASNVLKCRLRPVSAADYQVPVNLDQIRAVFPTGVCTWTTPTAPRHGTWLTY
jgi:Tannase-like family of unknown function (DUF6351)